MIKWEDGEFVTPAKINEDGTITPAVYSGKMPLSSYNLKLKRSLDYDSQRISIKVRWLST